MAVVRVLLWILCAAYWVTLFTLTHLPKVPTTLSGNLGDKAGHFLAYAVLAGVLYIAMWASGARGGRPGLFVIAVTFGYGVLDEITQPFVGRSCELLDWLADAAGVGAAVGVFASVRYVVERVGRGSEARGFEPVVQDRA